MEVPEIRLIIAAGSTAFELLRKSPGVVVDNNDNVILQGKTGIQIHINGKPSPLGGQDLVNFLKNLQSSEIEAIEVIANPKPSQPRTGQFSARSFHL